MGRRQQYLVNGQPVGRFYVVRQWLAIHILSKITANKVAAILFWIGGFLTSYMLVYALGADVLPDWMLFLLALGFEIGLTVLKRKWDLAGIAGTLLDTLINFGGVWWVVGKLDKTPTWEALVDAKSMDGILRPDPAFIIGLVLSFALAVAPKALWKRDDDDS